MGFGILPNWVMSETIIKDVGDARATANADSEHCVLPDQPLVTIEPDRGFGGAWLRELWAYRELLLFLAWRDIKVRYKQTTLGILWVVLQPLLMTIVFSTFFGVLARVPSDGLPYPLLVFAGLLPWNFFSVAVIQSGSSIVGNTNLITKVYFPRLIIPAAAIAARLVDFGVAFLILIGLMAYYRVVPSSQAAALPALVLLTSLLALGCGTLVAALNVKYRDVGVLLPVVMQLWMFVSPVLYSSQLIRNAWPRGYRIYELNPLAGIVEGFRSALFGRPLDWLALGRTGAITLIVLAGSAYLFRRIERGFADVI
jgi:lipopolysaccharide transport system permease protein